MKQRIQFDTQHQPHAGFRGCDEVLDELLDRQDSESFDLDDDEMYHRQPYSEPREQ